jgi:hypothetical protein
MENIGIKVEGVSSRTLEDLTTAILLVLDTPVGDSVKMHALDTLKIPFGQPITIANCNIQMGNT